MRIRFAEWTFDPETRELALRGVPAHLSPKAFELLEILIRERPRALAKKELLERLWPDTFVTEGNLASLVAEVREALQDEARSPRFVRTHHAFGYAFCGEAVAEAPAERRSPTGALRLIWDRREIALAEGETILGRAPEATVWVDDVSVSRRHARIVVREGQATLEDLGSRNGTQRGGNRLNGPEVLADGDELRLGTVRMTFRVFSTATTTETVPEG